jgi:hypothetical protein
MNATLPGLPKVGDGELRLEDQYRENGEGLKNAPYEVVDALGKMVEGTLDGSGKAMANGLALGAVKVFFGKDPRDPWDDSSYFGKLNNWPEREPEEIADLGSFNPVLARQMEAQLPAGTKAVLEKAASAANGVLSEIRNLPNLSGLAGSIPELSEAAGLPGILSGAGDVPGWGGQISLSQNLPTIPAGFDALNKPDALRSAFTENPVLSSDFRFGELGEISGISTTVPGIADILERPAKSHSGALPFPGTPPFVGGTDTI